MPISYLVWIEIALISFSGVDRRRLHGYHKLQEKTLHNQLSYGYEIDLWHDVYTWCSFEHRNPQPVPIPYQSQRKHFQKKHGYRGQCKLAFKDSQTPNGYRRISMELLSKRNRPDLNKTKYKVYATIVLITIEKH